MIVIRNCILILSGFVFLIACANADESYDIDSIYKYCRTDFQKSGIIEKLSFESGELHKYYGFSDNLKIRFVSIILNPQDEKNIQSIVIKWRKKPGLSSSQIMENINHHFSMENKQNVKIINTDSKTIYRFKGQFDNVIDTDIECEKGNLNRCWAITFTCSEFIHD